jgi:hypothetical protein
MDTMVGAPVSPVGVRLRRPGWRDPKLGIGVLIVAAAVALGSWVVSAAEASTPVYVAAEALTPGETVGADQVAVARVRLQTAEAGRYLSAAEPLPAGSVVVRAVGDGELLPRAAVARSADLDVRPVAIEVTEPPSAGVAEGALVDVWVTPEVQDGQAPVPRLLAERLTVAEVARPSGAFAVGAETTVHVLVPTKSLADVLGALATRQAVDVVLVPGTGKAP